MCVRSQFYPLMKHVLLSAYKEKWQEIYLLMFTIFIDDSGTAPDQKLAVAAAIFVPAKQLVSFEKEWNAFLKKEELEDFHSSECLARNPHSVFAMWDDDRVKRVFARIQQITSKYSVKSYCLAVHKQDYDEVIPKEMRASVGQSHYTWAVSSVLGYVYDWSVERSVPIEYVFDNASKDVKREIEDALAIAETVYPGHFSGNYSFRSRKDVPGLQMVDLFAWAASRRGCHLRFEQPIHPIVNKCWEIYEKMQGGSWCEVQALNREGLEGWVGNTYGSLEDLRTRTLKNKLKEARKPKKKTP
jgi:Protein of unknown function (DUF3800)